MLSIRGLSKTFGQGPYPVEVLKEVNLEVAEGEFVSLIGPSGCGKTTMLRIVAGLIPPTSGEVLLRGKPSLKPSREKGFVFQHFNLFPWRTSLSNATYGMELRGDAPDEMKRKGEARLRSVGLKGFERHFPFQISGGMKQRVGLARALLIDPSLLLMDEPFGALDALTREVLQEELIRISENEKKTFLFVTHSIDEAVYLSDRVIVMGAKPGRIVKEFRVPLARPRAESAVRSDPVFHELRSQIWTLLKEQMRG